MSGVKRRLLSRQTRLKFCKARNSDQEKELKTHSNELSGIIKLQQKILGDLKSKLDQNPTEFTKVALEGQISESEQILKNAQTAFESIVTGGLDLENFQEMPDQSFDWQSDLIEIIQPIFQSLKDLTEQPRAMERIRKTIEFYQQNLWKLMTLSKNSGGKASKLLICQQDDKSKQLKKVGCFENQRLKEISNYFNSS